MCNVKGIAHSRFFCFTSCNLSKKALLNSEYQTNLATIVEHLAP